jgi:hypothetical protein
MSRRVPTVIEVSADRRVASGRIRSDLTGRGRYKRLSVSETRRLVSLAVVGVIVAIALSSCGVQNMARESDASVSLASWGAAGPVHGKAWWYTFATVVVRGSPLQIRDVSFLQYGGARVIKVDAFDIEHFPSLLTATNSPALPKFLLERKHFAAVGATLDAETPYALMAEITLDPNSPFGGIAGVRFTFAGHAIAGGRFPGSTAAVECGPSSGLNPTTFRCLDYASSLVQRSANLLWVQYKLR